MRHLLAGILLLATEAGAHDAPTGWKYDYDCCSEKDCHVIPENQTPRVTPDGYRLHDGLFVPKYSTQRRDSQDMFWHRCDGAFFRDGIKAVRCLYVPSGGS